MPAKATKPATKKPAAKMPTAKVKAKSQTTQKVTARPRAQAKKK